MPNMPMRDMNELRLSLEKGTPLLLAGLGDSLTYGWEVSRGFFDRFVDKLERRYPGAELGRINAGVPGDVAPGGLRRLGSVLAQKPDVVFVQFALNDCFGGLPLEEYVQALENIVRITRENGALPVLCTSCPVTWPGNLDEIDAFYAAVLAVAEDMSVPGVALDAYWKQSDEGREGVDLFAEDGVHPTDLGHEIMARGLLAAMEKPQEGGDEP